MNRLASAVASFRRTARREEGQVLVLVVLCMVAFLGMAGLVIDVGQEHITESRLTTAANAAALAAGEYLPNTAAITTACTYGASLQNDPCNGVNQTANGYNSYATLTGVTTTTQIECLSSASAGTGCVTGTACPSGDYPPYGTANNVTGCNAIKVTEQATVNPWFMSILGFGGQRITASATASSAGGIPHPLNAEIVDDSTGSMAPPYGTSDTCGGTPTGVPSTVTLYQEDCAKAGIRALLATLDPCLTTFTTCPAASADNVPTADALDEVGLVTFPGLAGKDSNNQNVVTASPSAPLPDELNCTTDLSSANISYSSGATYQVVPFSSDYRLSDTSNPNSPLATLNTASNLVKSVYWPGDGCGANGGYPVTGTAAPIAGGGSGDITTATDQPAPLGGGGSADSASASNGGIAFGAETDNTAIPLAIGGGPNSGDNGDVNTASTGISGDSGSTGVFPSSPGTTLYGDAHASLNLTTTSSNGQYVPAATTISGLQVTLSGPTTGSTATLTVNVMKNAAASGLSCSVTAPATTFTCSGGPVTFNGTTDKLNLDFTRSSGGVPNTNPTASWTLTSSSTATGITISRPANAATNDFLLLTVTAQGAGVTGSSNICPTAATTNWTLVDQNRVAGTVIQDTYSSTRANANAENYTFNFFSSGTCAVDTGAGNLSLTASATVVRYTNVAGIDTGTGAPAGATGVPSNPNFSGSATSTQWAKGTSTITSGAPSSTWGAGPSYVSLTGATCFNITYATCARAPAVGTITGFTFTFGTALTSTRGYSITLYKQGTAQAGATCTIGSAATPTSASQTTCTVTGLNVAVNGTDTVALGVVRQAGTSAGGTATTSATDVNAAVTNYVSLASSSVGTTAGGAVAPNDAQITTTGTLTSANLTFGSAVPAGDTATVTLFDNGVSTGLSCTINAAQSTCATPITGGGTYALNAADRVELQVTASGTASFTATASSTNLVESVPTTLTAPAVTPTQANEMIVRLFGTGSTSYTAGSALPLTVASGSTATGVDDNPGPAAGTSAGTDTATSTTPDDWVAQTVALKPVLPSSIQVVSPATWAPNTTDVMLVTVAVQGSGIGQVCAPAAAPAWNTVATTTDGSGATALTQTTFWTTTAAAGTYTFSFFGSASGCTGAKTGTASVVAAYYTGVDTTGATPIDRSAVPGSPPAAGTTLTAPPVTTALNDDEVVSLFATDGTFTAPLPAYTNTSTAFGNSGLDNTLQQVAGASTAVTQTSSSAAWTAQTIALKPLLSSSITVAPPSGYVAGDFMLVTVAAQNLGSAVICAPTDATWTPVPVAGGNTVTQGTLTQETFWTTGVSTGTFTFYPTSSCTGTAVNTLASAAAVYYTGVDTTTPFDGVTPVAAKNSTAVLQPAAVTTNTANDEVVSLFATNSTFAAPIPGVVSTSGPVVNSGVSGVGRGTAGAYTPASVGSTTAAAWTVETIALKPDSTMTSVTISRPPNPTTGDFILVTVTANGLSAANNICAPNDGTWTQVGTTQNEGGTLSQATYYSFRGTTTPETYQFSFRSGSCPSGGSLVPAPASAIAVRFTGVNPIIPIDATTQKPSTGTTVAPPAVTPTYANDQVVGLYGSSTTSFSAGIPPGQSVSGASSSTAFTQKAAAGAGVPTTPVTATIPSGNWIGQSIALEAEAAGCNNCQYGLEVPVPFSYDTNYGLPMASAVTALQAENAVRPAEDAIILLSDGDANTAQTDPCQQGIQAAENAESAGMLVFVIAYGAITNTSGCTLDSSHLYSGSYDNPDGLSPQCALELMVDNHITNPSYATDTIAAQHICSTSLVTSIPGFPNYFSQAPDTSLEKVFQQVGTRLTSARLVSNNAT